jgi:hypothetical protein
LLQAGAQDLFLPVTGIIHLEALIINGYNVRARAAVAWEDIRGIRWLLGFT